MSVDGHDEATMRWTPVAHGGGASAALRAADEDVEMQLIREEGRNSEIASILIGSLLLFSLLVPSFAHLRTVISISVLCTAACTLTLKLHLALSDRESLVRRAKRAGDLNLLIRTAVHVFVIFSHNDEVYMRLITLFVFPLASARGSHNPSSFLVYSAAHLALVVFRFQHDWNANAPYVVATLFTMPMLVDVSVQRKRARESAVNLAQSYKSVRGLAESTARSLIRGFCDAVVTLGPDFRLVEQSLSLGALLNGHFGKDKYFPDLLEMGDRDDFRSRMEEIAETVLQAGPDGALLGPGQPNSLSLRVHMMDGFSHAVPVHIFHTCFLRWDWQPIYLLGISEAWQPKAKASAKDRSRASSNLNMETGKVELNVPSFPQGGKGLKVEKSSTSLAIDRGERKPSQIQIEKMPAQPKTTLDKVGFRSSGSSGVSGTSVGGIRSRTPVLGGDEKGGDRKGGDESDVDRKGGDSPSILALSARLCQDAFTSNRSGK